MVNKKRTDVKSRQKVSRNVEISHHPQIESVFSFNVNILNNIRHP